MESRDGSSSARVISQTPEVLHMEHRTTRRTRLAGPHWHPELAETFTVRTGRVAIAVDGTWHSLGPGDSVTIPAGAVHESRVEEADLVMDHEVTPPGRHRQMFEVMFALDRRGLLGSGGVPLDPLALGLLWDFQDGYLAGVPPRLQRAVFGGLARVARRTGRHRRLARDAGVDPRTWE
ncbi:cupin domain-containing protein [Actinomycetospora lutea]|uniref:cupin domain-containing protein n=1 Tax=Actinomycetospora lutea TaxID=663604 RepID=UPI002365F2DF|nr:cupin domain-containing protein [Actinomycetospora lutea]MDD7941817.1 cupin domain-containing protein [Actinomycetospora lutea]